MHNNIRDSLPALLGKGILIYLLCGLSFSSAKGQPALVNEFTQINLTGEVSLTFNDVSIVNNGDISFLDLESKTIAIYGNSDFENHSFSGQNIIPITNFLMNKPGRGLSLKTDLAVFGEAIFNGGLLVLEDGAAFRIDQSLIAGSGLIESENSRITGENGSIITFMELDAPSAVNPGNLGVAISSTSNLEVTEVIRRHAPEMINASEGIARTFEINPRNNTDLQATLRFHYFDAELNGNEESSLAVFQQEGMEWMNVPIVARNTDENWIETAPLDRLSMFVIGTDPCGPVDNTVTLTGKTLTVSEQGASYQWIDCDNGNTPIDGANERSFVAQTTGNYAVIITAENCEITSVCTFVDVEACNTTSETAVEACDSYTWLGMTYTEPGTYTATIPNSVGCDSLLTLNLTIQTVDSEVSLLGKTLTVGEADSYQWIDCDNGDAPIDGANGPSFIAEGTGNYAVIVRQGDCEETSACTFVDVDACNTSSTAAAEACDSYTWLGTEYTGSGTYTATIPNSAGCDSLLTLNLVIHTVDTEVIESEGMLTSQQDNATYQWLDCNNENAPVQDATSQSFTPSAGGSYAVEVTTAQGCVQTSACTMVDVVLSIEESSFARLVSLYPNPTTSELHIDLGETYTQIEVNITSTDGKVIDKLQLTHTDKITYQLDGQPGIYFIEVTSGDERAIFRLIKQ